MSKRSNFRRALPHEPVLASLRSVEMVADSKAVLPAGRDGQGHVLDDC